MNKRKTIEDFEIDIKSKRQYQHQREAFINAFKEIANKAMNDYHNNIHKQDIKEVKKPDEAEENLA